MKKNIDRLLIIGDELTQRQNHIQSRINSEMEVIDLYDSDNETTKTGEDTIPNQAGIINLATTPLSLSWYDYLIDDIFYKMHQLKSSLSFASEPRAEVRAINLDYYLETYISSRLTIEPSLETIEYTSLSRDDLSNLQKIDTIISNKKKFKAKTEQTLVIEWVGIHDLKHYASEQVEYANTDHLVNKYIQHLTRLINLGYKNFCIMGPIQTHLTSQKKSTVSLYNVNLQIELSELISYHPDCSITYIDVQTSLEFLGQTVGEDLRLSTESLQAIATVIIEQAIIPNYNFIVPEEILLAQFRQAFHANWRTDKNSILGILISDPSIDYHKASLSEIIQHAKDKPRSRTANILKALGWIDIAGSITKKMTCITPHPLIKSTWDNPEDITSKVEYK